MKGSLLTVDLSRCQYQREDIPSVDIEHYLGGRGLGAVTIYRRLTPKVDPLGTENILVFSTGPLTGTYAPCSSRFSLTTKSPLTGLYTYSISGGYFGPALKKAGIGTLVIKGKASGPTYLLIEGGEVVFKDASKLWGMTTGDTQEFVKSEHRDKSLSTVAIGPAGENVVPYACIMSERRALGRGGGGAVMGSKNLKAIGVRGTKSIPVADPTRFRRSVKNAFSEIRKNRATSETYPKYGTTALVEILNGFGILPAKNWQELPSLEIEQITAKALRESFVVKDVYCAPPCPVKCSKVTFAKAGFYAGALTEGPEYETIFAFGPCCGVYDASTIIAADAYCDQYGLDTISAGVSIAFAMECFEKQIIDRVMTEGDELRFGNKDLIVPMLHKIAYRKGFGRILAQGTKKMAEEFGKGTSDFAMHAKGMELGGYDPRGVKGMAIVFACGPRGGCHHAGGFTVFSEVLSGEFDRFAESGKASLVKKTRNRRASVCDSGSLCTFGAFGMSDEVIANMISAVTGCDLSTADIYTIGERIGCIERCFNVREGLNRGWDILPTRFLKESMHGGPNQGQTVHLSMMIDEFYESCGWDTENGSPIPAKLKELGLEWISHSHSDRERNLS